VPDIVRDNRIRLTRHSQFKDDLVAVVGKKRPEPEVNVRLAAGEAERPNDGIDGALRNLQSFSLTFPTASYSRMRATEIRGGQASPMR